MQPSQCTWIPSTPAAGLILVVSFLDCHYHGIRSASSPAAAMASCCLHSGSGNPAATPQLMLSFSSQVCCQSPQQYAATGASDTHAQRSTEQQCDVIFHGFPASPDHYSRCAGQYLGLLDLIQHCCCCLHICSFPCRRRAGSSG